MAAFLSAVKALHGRFVLRRRFRVLAHVLAEHITSPASVLDIGCGPGTIARLIQERKPSISIRGLEIAARPACLIDFDLYDGRKFPQPDASVDVCMFVDVLHHTDRIEELVRESCRVSRRYVLIKDHLSENWLDDLILRLMDWVGNRPHEVALPYNYLSRQKWDGLFRACHLRVRAWRTQVPLYPFPFNLLFGRQLHFIALLEKQAPPVLSQSSAAAD